jgi:hypothetical protein
MARVLKALFFFLISFHLIAQSKSSFEGEVTYIIDIELKEGVAEKYLDYFHQKFGDTMASYHSKKGSIKRVYKGTNTSGFDFHLYDETTNRYYSKNKNQDTIHFFDASTNILKLVNKKQSNNTNVTILGEDCSSISYSAIDSRNGQKSNITFYFGSKYYINPDLYREWYDFFTNDFFKISKSPYLKYVLDDKYFRLTFTAISIKEKNIEHIFFKLPNELPLKKQ